VNDDLVQSVDQKICERWGFTISELLCKFPQISHTVLYKIITVSLGLSQVLCKVGSENAKRYAQNAENDFGFNLFRAVPQRWQ
jgi:hypothetical protein